MKPRRIQRQRTKGWRMPEGAVYVGRPTEWGNPYTVSDVARRFPSLSDHQARAFAVNQFRHDLRSEHPGYPGEALIIGCLRGKDLVCWCAPMDPCHADVLLEIANGGDPR